MKNTIKKLFYWDDPARGALFGAVLFLTGSWILLAVTVLLGGVTPDRRSLLYFGIAEILLFCYLLICGVRFGKLYLKELNFSRRWKWQIPATICWILLAFPVLQIFNIFFILDDAVSSGPCLQFSQLMSGKLMIALSCAGFSAMFAGIFCTAKIIENAAQISWKKLFGKEVALILLLFVVAVIVLGSKIIPLLLH